MLIVSNSTSILNNKSYNLVPCGLFFNIFAILIFSSISLYSFELNILSVFSLVSRTLDTLANIFKNICS
nr:MAG TPA: hypothetical protein [Caudoviricetes sp.]